MSDDNADAFSALDAQIARVQSLETAPQEIAKEGAKELDAIIRANILKGQAPDGTAWSPTKSGEPALRGAGKALSTTAQGTVIVASLEGPEALHHLGFAKGGVKRQILPTRALPGAMVQALKAVADRVLRRKLEG